MPVKNKKTKNSRGAVMTLHEEIKHLRSLNRRILAHNEDLIKKNHDIYLTKRAKAKKSKTK